jgi:maltoporin
MVIREEGWNEWVSFGARPQCFFTDHLSLALEAGLDRTKSANGQYDGWLRKFTIAPANWSRPQVLVGPCYVSFTYASWSNGLRGHVGGIPSE